MSMRKIWAAFTLSALLCACQADPFDSEQPEQPIEDDATESPMENEKPNRIVVRASLPESGGSRAQIVYGGEDESGETFLWNDKDWITLFNISKLEECPYGVQLETVRIDGGSADFESAEDVDPSFRVEAGDVLLAMYGEILPRFKNATTLDERKIFTFSVGTEANKPQYIVENPDTSLSYMKDNLKMYDIVTVIEDGVVPSLHFKHLSALLRITLHNASGKDIYPTNLEFKYPTGPDYSESDEDDDNQENSGDDDSSGLYTGKTVYECGSFFSTTMYFSVEGNSDDGYSFKIYDTDEFFLSSSKPYTYKISTTINGKNGTYDSGNVIHAGATYNLYLSTVPRIDNDIKGDKLIINLVHNHQTKTPYSCTIEGFDRVIKPGLRYWFKLTATPDGKLMRTSQWENQ